MIHTETERVIEIGIEIEIEVEEEIRIVKEMERGIEKETGTGIEIGIEIEREIGKGVDTQARVMKKTTDLKRKENLLQKIRLSQIYHVDFI